MSKSMDKMGYEQGNMKPTVDNYQRPAKVYSQEGFSKTTEYVARNDATQTKYATDIKKQAYKGRYS